MWANSYRNEYKTGIQFNYYEENEKSSCEIAGYLKREHRGL